MLRRKKGIMYGFISLLFILLAICVVTFIDKSSMNNHELTSKKVLVKIKEGTDGSMKIESTKKKLNGQNIYALNIDSNELNKLDNNPNYLNVEEDSETRLLCLDEQEECISGELCCSSKDDSCMNEFQESICKTNLDCEDHCMYDECNNCEHGKEEV